MGSINEFLLERIFYVMIAFGRIYQDSSALQTMTSYLHSMLELFMTIFSGMHKELKDPVWFSMNWISYDSGLDPKFKIFSRGYECSMVEPKLEDKLCVDMLNTAFTDGFSNEAKNIAEGQLTIYDPLLVCKLPSLSTESCGSNNVYLFRRWKILEDDSEKILKNILLNTGFGYSKTHFLACTYKCGSTNISFDIPKQWTMIGNELFSPSFMMRLLESQPWYYTMDSTYTVELFDSEMEFVKIDSRQYLRMANCSAGYEICKIEDAEKIDYWGTFDNDNDSDVSVDDNANSEEYISFRLSEGLETFVMLEKDKMD